jgi:hypothetical protein
MQFVVATSQPAPSISLDMLSNDSHKLPAQLPLLAAFPAVVAVVPEAPALPPAAAAVVLLPAVPAG